MPSTSIACGILLILVGIIGAVAANIDGKEFKTALIPAAIGIILLLLGVFARYKENLRKHLMHAAVLVALLGFIGALFAPGIKGVIKTGQIGNYTSFFAQVAMALICLIFVILCVKSFIDARKSNR
jgi:hypothetical protein